MAATAFNAGDRSERMPAPAAAALLPSLRGASDAAYRAVRRPVEGTMLSVIRELAEEAERRAGEPGPLGEVLVELVRHGESAVARTPEQLEVLREAGVVDAGGAGLVELLRGVAGAVSGEAVWSLVAKGALHLAERSRTGHLVEVRALARGDSFGVR